MSGDCSCRRMIMPCTCHINEIQKLEKAVKDLKKMLSNRQKRMCIYREALEKIMFELKGMSDSGWNDEIKLIEEALGAEGR